MPIEIRELVIRAIVSDEAKDQRVPETLTVEPDEPDQEALIQACVEQALKVLRRERER